MFKNFWYACGPVDRFTSQPTRVRILGQSLAVFRDEGGALVALSDICPHRGGSLSLGTPEKGCIRCPYHGWKFARDGRCVEVPAAGREAAAPRRARVDAYPAAERYGFAWVFLGDAPEDQRPPLPDFPGWTESGFRAVYGEYLWHANYERVVENSLDPAHAAWVHKASFGNNATPEVPPYEVTEREWGAEASLVIVSPKLKGLWGKLRKRQNEVHVVNGFTMPNMTYVHMKFGQFETRLFNVAVPVDRATTITYWVLLRSFFKSRLFDKDTVRRTHKIFLEDAPMVENQRPELVPDELNAELHVRADALQIAYRKMRRRTIERGWSIEPHERETREGLKVALIPSPARRDPESKGTWVFPAVASP